LPIGAREFQAEVSRGLSSLAPGITSLLDPTVADRRVGDRADAAWASSTLFIETEATACTNNTVRAMAGNTSPGATFGFTAATFSVEARKRRTR
jgi:hypothetical protein